MTKTKKDVYINGAKVISILINFKKKGNRPSGVSKLIIKNKEREKRMEPVRNYLWRYSHFNKQVSFYLNY